LGDHASALNYFDKAIKIDPKYYQALYGKGLLLREIGNHEGSIKYFNKALSLNPNYQEDKWLQNSSSNITTPASATTTTEPTKTLNNQSNNSNQSTNTEFSESLHRLELSKSSRGPEVNLDLSKGVTRSQSSRKEEEKLLF
jgi:tetratricopeptide (TPR) repeat protein